MMDISSSPNTVSTAASTSSAPSQKQQPQKTIAQVTPDARAAKVKKIVKSDMVPTPKNNAPLSHSSRAQTAVLAPTTPAQFDSAYLKNPAPSYPPLSRRMGEQGSILLSVFVNEMGQAQDIRLKQSSGYERLDAAALETVKRWRFVAAKQEERLVASWVNVPIKFVLE
jgi:protein TonB